ncbi:MAG: hypothetical protein M1826_004882 [Phylliscum demangeonii]|nr:MAG: hypothetical protein M1826_004882 [Phylliscum demangeonii]
METKKIVERRFRLPGDRDLIIQEETALISNFKGNQGKGSDKIRQLLTLEHSKRGKIIELGSGCGTVGIAFAQCVPGCDVLLTDLPEAQEIITANIATMTPAPGSRASFQVLDWDDDLPDNVARTKFDLVLVSDCTYNSSSAASLVKILDTLVSSSSETLIILARKERHSSEAVFFDLLQAAGIQQIERDTVSLPLDAASETMGPSNFVEIYTLGKPGLEQ